MNSINWPALSVWVFIAQLIEHCSANAEATVRIPLKPRKTFLRDTSKLVKLRFNCDGHIFISLEPYNKTFIVLARSARTGKILETETMS